MQTKWVGAVFFGWVAVAGCASGKTMSLTASNDLPAAQGEVKVKGDGPNNVVTVTVKHLAPIEKARPGASAYVVWLRPAGTSDNISLGQLQVNKDLEGRLQANTPYKDFDIFVTAEQSPAVTAPSMNQVLRAQSSSSGVR